MAGGKVARGCVSLARRGTERGHRGRLHAVGQANLIRVPSVVNEVLLPGRAFQGSVARSRKAE